MEQEFKAGQYIVLLEGQSSSYLPLNYIYKQKEDHQYLSVVCDLDGDPTRSSWHKYDKSNENNWRFATSHEINQYDDVNGPVPVEEVTEFKKDDYIVLLDGRMNDENFKLNYIYKQKHDSIKLDVYLDCQRIPNGWAIHDFNKSYGNDWRYATADEIKLYNIWGEPVSITMLMVDHVINVNRPIEIVHHLPRIA